MNPKTKQKSSIQEVLEIGAEVTGSITAALIQSTIEPAAGIFLSAAGGPILTHTFKAMADQLTKNYFGERSIQRSSAVFGYALLKIAKLDESQQTIREESFFKSDKYGRSPAEELLEAAIISAEKEYEERKLQYLGNLYANIVVNPEIKREYAIHFIRIINQLSFRHLCLMELFYKRFLQREELVRSKLRGLDDHGIRQADIISEIYDLEQKGLLDLHIPLTYDAKTGRKDTLAQDKINLTALGKSFCELLSLNEIPEEALDELNELTKIII